MKRKLILIFLCTLSILLISSSSQDTGVPGGGRSDHVHLGQTWTGSEPLVINGTYEVAPLVLSNESWDGLRISSALGRGVAVDSAGRNGFLVESAGRNGLYVGSSGTNGMIVDSAGTNGVYVVSAGTHGMLVESAVEDGLFVGSAGNLGVGVGSAGDVGYWVGSVDGSGLWVGNAGDNGVGVESTDGNGLWVASAGNNGVAVDSASYQGIYIGSTGDNGLYVANAGNNGVAVDSADNYAGWFNGSIYASGGCVGCTITVFGVNVGSIPLQPGDIVSIQGLISSEFAEAATLMQVKAAENGESVIGVVQGPAEANLGINSQQENSKNHLVPRQGTVEPGDYVVIIIYGPSQVKVSALSGPISAGARLTVGDNGGVRTLAMTEINGVQIAESASTIGIALEEPGNNELVWVLINPQ